MGFAQTEQPAAAAPAASVSPERTTLILKFIDVFDTKKAMEENLDLMIKSMPADDPQTQKIKSGVNVDEIIQRLVPLYAAKFTDEQLNAFIAFYSSPDGQKLLSEIPQIMQESVDVTAQYFDEKFPEMNEPANQETQANTEEPAANTGEIPANTEEPPTNADTNTNVSQ